MGIAGIDGGGGGGGCDSPVTVRTGKYKPQMKEKILRFTPAFYQSDSMPVHPIYLGSGSKNVDALSAAELNELAARNELS